jgi:hypothetical protein
VHALLAAIDDISAKLSRSRAAGVDRIAISSAAGVAPVA